MELKSLDRINKMIDEGKIKRIFCDGWFVSFVEKINELFGYKVDVLVFKSSDMFINTTEFKDGDCILFYEMENSKVMEFLKNRQLYEDYIFVKTLTEDIFLVDTLRNERNIVVDNNGITLKEYANNCLNDLYVSEFEAYISCQKHKWACKRFLSDISKIDNKIYLKIKIILQCQSKFGEK